MPAFPSLSALQQRQKLTVAATTSARPCVLTWTNADDVAVEVAAREGQMQRGSRIMRGAVTDEASVRFFIARALLARAPDIDTVIEIQGRTADHRWRVETIDAGMSPHDPEWVIACVQETD